MVLEQLKSHLWEAANILRGSAVDRTDWKGYILPLLFFKRISDVWDEEHARMLEQYGFTCYGIKNTIPAIIDAKPDPQTDGLVPLAQLPNATSRPPR